MKLKTLKHILTGRLIKKHFTRHFRRFAILEMLRGVQAGAEMPPTLSQSLTEAAWLEPDELLTRLGTHTNGLNEFEADAIHQPVGRNEVEHEKPQAWWAHLWHCFLLPMSPLAHYFKLQALPLDYFPQLAAILCGYAAATQAMKGIFARRYGWQ